MSTSSASEKITLTPVSGYERGYGVTLEINSRPPPCSVDAQSKNDHLLVIIPTVVEYRPRKRRPIVRCLPEQHAVCLV